MINLLYSLEKLYPVTQTWEEHRSWAISHSYCWYSAPGCTWWYYPGIDFGTPVGTKLLASISSRAWLTKETAGYGWSVKLEDGLGNKIVYGHLSKFLVEHKQTVNRGDIIGLSGYSGNVRPPGEDGAHLHWEYRINNVPTDPTPFIEALPRPPSDFVFVGDMVRFTGSPRIRTQPTALLLNNIIGKVVPQATMEKMKVQEIKYTNNIVWGRFDNLWIALKEGDIKYYENA